MPDPHRLLHTIRQAVRAFRLTPGRRGRVVYLEHADDLLVAGDMHGNVENFRRLLDVAQLDRFPHRHLILQELIHGNFTYPNGGDKSHQLLDLLAALKCQYPWQVHVLLGNHELSQWNNRVIAKGDQDLNWMFLEGIGEAYGALATQVYAAYLEMFAVWPLAVRTPNRVLVCHSVPTAQRLEKFDPAVLDRDVFEEEDMEPGGAVHSLLWGRDTKAPTVAAFLKKMDADLVITGHIMCDEGYAVPNDQQIILDTMAEPAAYCLFPAHKKLTHADLVGCVAFL